MARKVRTPLDLDSNKILNLGTPTVGTDAANKTYADLMIPKSQMDVKGDILIASANDTPSRFPVGADGQVPKVDSAATHGIAWQDVIGVDTFANRPAASTTRKGLMYLATDVGTLGMAFVCTGSAWRQLTDVIGRVTPGGVQLGPSSAGPTAFISATVPASFLVAGTQIFVDLAGNVDHRATVENFNLTYYVGATSSNALAMIADAVLRTNRAWRSIYQAAIITVGAAGTYRGLTETTDALAAAEVRNLGNNNSTAIDTTALAVIKIDASQVNNASNVFRAFQGTIRVVLPS